MQGRPRRADAPSLLKQRLEHERRRIRGVASAAPDVIAISDDDGLPRMVIGQQADGSWGVRIYDDLGNVAFERTT